MGQLDAVLNGLRKPEEKTSRDTSLDALSAKVDMLSNALQVLVGAMNNRDKNDDFTQSSIKKLAKAVQALGQEVRSFPDLRKSLARIEGDLGSVPREFPLPKDIVIPDNSESFKALEKIVSKIPTSFPKQRDTDLAPVLDAVFSVLEKVNEPIVIPKIKDKWVFKIERDAEDLITRVVVT